MIVALLLHIAPVLGLQAHPSWGSLRQEGQHPKIGKTMKNIFHHPSRIQHVKFHCFNCPSISSIVTAQMCDHSRCIVFSLWDQLCAGSRPWSRNTVPCFRCCCCPCCLQLKHIKKTEIVSRNCWTGTTLDCHFSTGGSESRSFVHLNGFWTLFKHVQAIVKYVQHHCVIFWPLFLFQCPHCRLVVTKKKRMPLGRYNVQTVPRSSIVQLIDLELLVCADCVLWRFHAGWHGPASLSFSL